MTSKPDSSMALASAIAAGLPHAATSVDADLPDAATSVPRQEHRWREAKGCEDCRIAAQQEWPGYTAGCPACLERMKAAAQPWHEYERRKRAWLDNNPGAWPLEVRDACARIAEELGL